MENQKSHKGAIITLSILLPVLTLSGVGGTYFVMDQKSTKANEDALKRIEALEKKVNENTTTKKEETTPTPTKTIIADNIINLKTLKVGDKVGAFNVKSIAPYRSEYSALSNSNIKIEFTGTTTVTGTYEYTAPDSNTMFGGDFFKFDKLDSASKKKIPTLNDGIDWFGFTNNTSELKQGFEIKGSKDTTETVTIMISDFTFVRYPSEVFSTATYLIPE
ncbi:TPA: hypothetical protein DDW69_00740 [candidate division CPR2 bacterium]|uniref:Uncharacterized protein n=1 Tax=candidate division CPR2 bacterium GW2011_GWC1_41_48 TaxID=1618344 RepID=A0A0G0W9Y9_UNCC2|nr:MAG: hypothetical protein UT47_C0004G0041 [candidate division CPR2 bacterium GW2011_GWC2_39_35]KKR27181.1 MAG: hypothetical protein UT60_C0059G0037 [candidate division CPR2 bacterium GW2011_GWD2_39_7]KKR29192.1 MAG: hypothetical protein UT59_C0011G0016 [candidate division CPR2 bacterium GW2011_GWD1_39_7]KKS08867.1 MAG: hypothetical protein UU65_C0004G0078 [candidate division CPR2 bacterium GW2011_GWC1_41_48]OGB62171.1 MAG: hypothetical protein A2Y27_01620 [candidate division CPR2 bacterium G